MPWTPADATRHQKLATTSRLKRMWTVVANAELAKHGDDAKAIKAANAVVHRAAGSGPKHKPRKK